MRDEQRNHYRSAGQGCGEDVAHKLQARTMNPVLQLMIFGLAGESRQGSPCGSKRLSIVESKTAERHTRWDQAVSEQENIAGSPLIMIGRRVQRGKGAKMAASIYLGVCVRRCCRRTPAPEL